MDEREEMGTREGGVKEEEWLTTWQECWRRGRDPLGVYKSSPAVGEVSMAPFYTPQCG